jgi:hypothetical protein
VRFSGSLLGDSVCFARMTPAPDNLTERASEGRIILCCFGSAGLQQVADAGSLGFFSAGLGASMQAIAASSPAKGLEQIRIQTATDNDPELPQRVRLSVR